MSFDIATLPKEARAYVEALEAEKRQMAWEIKLRDEQIRLLNHRLFGPKSEKLSPGQTQLLLQEASVTAGEVEQEAARPSEERQNPLPKRKTPRSRNPGRDPLPAHLERREVIVRCAPEDRRCENCPGERPVIGYETREELVCEPAAFWVRVVKREILGSHHHADQGVTTAPAPPRIVPKGKLSDEFIIEALAQKYQQHLPVYRQVAALADNHGVELARKTVTDAVVAAGGLLAAVVGAMAAELRAGRYIQADETTMPCQTREKTGKNHRAFIWEFSRPGGIVVFDFQMSRARAGPREFLQGFRGKLQCDGYLAYDKLGEGITYVGCMAHARREFVEAAQLAPLDPRPKEVIALFGKLYAVEAQAREKNLGPEERRALRQAQSAPGMEALKKRIVEIRQNLSPGTKLAKACDYTLGQWTRLEEYLSDGLVEIDNNWCEGAMRPLVLGRKNWLHVGSEEVGPKIAAIASIVETCRRLDVNLRKYLTDVLPKLGDWPANKVAELTPAAWKAAQKS